MEKNHYDTLETMHGTFQTTLTKKHLARKPWEPENPKHIKSSIPGTVVKVCVAEGQAVKMNNNIKATFAGKVKKIDVKEGDNIPNHALMIEME